MKAASGTAQGKIVFLHSSNEMYGADKILLEVIRALPDEDRSRCVVWLPDDVPTGQNSLSRALDAMEVSNEIVPMAVLRRRYLKVSGLGPLVARMSRTFIKLRATRPDVVYCTTSAMVLCLPMARLLRVKTIILHMQEIWSPREAGVLGLFARAARRIFCISNAARDSLPKQLKERADLLVNAHQDNKTTLVPVSVDPQPLRFVVASRWNAWKGHTPLLAAWDTEFCPGELVIMGGPPAVGTGVDVQSLASRVRHSNRITIVGEVDDISPHIDAADFLILPSEQPEPFGLVLLEAFARGRAVVATAAGGVVDIVSDGVDGELYPIGQPGALITSLKSLDRAAAVRMGANARTTYEKRFSIEAFRTRFQFLWAQEIVSVSPSRLNA
ncbi:glycosyltransferase [Paenarthrobacter nitroguajacolicus]|uniref:glycosyltransferase n=1 Tax=Paenarthrobacter nitroguajacolicus TaxID=211146 RepID=UPI000A48298C|nr:glycosyltransferase [Paenarthrobacter nitroguajacolicus]